MFSSVFKMCKNYLRIFSLYCQCLMTVCENVSFIQIYEYQMDNSIKVPFLLDKMLNSVTLRLKVINQDQRHTS